LTKVVSDAVETSSVAAAVAASSKLCASSMITRVNGKPLSSFGYKQLQELIEAEIKDNY